LAQVTYVQGKALRLTRVARQPIKMLYVHGSTLGTLDSPTLKFEIDSPTGDRQIPYSKRLAVVPGLAPLPTSRTHGRFFRRRKVMMRAYLSPKMPFNVEW